MIIELLPPDIFQFLEEIESLGFSLCLVGGITRDYFLTQKLSYDLDFEIRPSQLLENFTDVWPSYYKKLHSYLIEKKLNYTELPYLITRVHFRDRYFEFSSPRTEISISGNYTHHHFQATLDPNLTYQASFRRRDFSINAIGIELKLKSSEPEKIIDPFNGIDDLKNKVLRNISDEFFLDSVRFLRLIRFKLKFENFVVEDKLFSKLDLFNLAELSIHHFTQELFKSQPGAFLNFFSELVILKKLKIPENFKFWTKYTFPVALSTREELLAYVFLQNENDAHQILVFFSMPDKKLKDLKSFVRSFEAIQRLKKQNFLDLLALPTEDALKNEIFKDLKNLEEKKEWRHILNLISGTNELLIKWSDWSNVSVDEVELNLIDPPLRSYYKYFKTLKKILK